MGLMVYLRNYRGDFFWPPSAAPSAAPGDSIGVGGKMHRSRLGFLVLPDVWSEKEAQTCRLPFVPICLFMGIIRFHIWFALFISFPCFFGSSCSSQMGPTWSVFSARSSARFPPVTRHAARGARVHRHDDCVFTSRQFTVTIAGLVGGLGSRWP